MGPRQLPIKCGGVPYNNPLMYTCIYFYTYIYIYVCIYMCVCVPIPRWFFLFFSNWGINLWLKHLFETRLSFYSGSKDHKNRLDSPTQNGLEIPKTRIAADRLGVWCFFILAGYVRFIYLISSYIYQLKNRWSDLPDFRVARWNCLRRCQQWIP